MSLYGDSSSFRTQKVLAAAKLANKQLQVNQGIPPAQISPLGLLPALDDGTVNIFGAEAICKYILADQPRYYPKDSQAVIDQWLFWGEANLLPNVLCYVLPSISAANVGEKNIEEAKAELTSQLSAFNHVLEDKTYLVGERLTIADFCVAFNLLPAYQYVLGEKERAKIANVNRWFMTVMHQPGVKETFTEQFSFIAEPAKFDENAYKKIQAQLASSVTAKSSKGGAEKPPKKSDKKEEQEEMDAADEAIAEQPKFVDPLSTLPPGTFVMDAFKRVYSNEDTATKAIPYFWDNFDTENYSIWYGEYKYPDELKQVFMSCNLITGMFQRLEKLKKHAFGSVCLFGTDNNSSISGIWVWRGKELAFELCPDWQVDYDVYGWKKLDPKNEANKQLINDYLLWEGNFGGKQLKFNQGKIFK